MKVRTLFILGVVTLLLISTVFVTTAQGAPAAQAENGSGGPVSNPNKQLTSRQSSAIVAYWTADRMAAASPLDMQISKNQNQQQGQVPAAASIAPTGAAVAVGGNLPGQVPDNVTAPVGSVTEPFGFGTSPASAVQAWYSYPFPYATSNIAASWPSWYPFSTNGKIFFRQNGGDYVCSGTSTTSGSGGNRRLVWTAGHCVHAGDNLYSGWSTNVLFCPGYANGANSTFGCWAGIDSWTSWAWYSTSNLKYDQGVVITADTSSTGKGRLGDTVGTQGLAWNWGYVQQFWAFGYPAAAPYTGNWQVMTSASTAEADDPNGMAGPYTIGIGSDQTGGSSGGGWIVLPRLGNWGWLNSVNSYKYTSPARPLAMYGPYFDTFTGDLWNAVRTLYP